VSACEGAMPAEKNRQANQALASLLMDWLEGREGPRGA